MSQGIRDQVHGYIEHILSDQNIKKIGETLKLAAGKHTIPVPINVKFSVDDDGLAKVTIGGVINLKIPEWDSPIDLTGQMQLFTESGNAQPTRSQAKAAKAEEEEADSGRQIPESELSAPEVKPGGDIPADLDIDAALGEPGSQANVGGGEALSPEAARKMEARDAENKELLEKAARGEIQLDPSAKAAIRAQLEARGKEEVTA